MKPMSTTTAKTLTCFAAILVIIAFMVISPSGALFSSAVAALVAVFPSVFSRGKVRLVAVVLLLASLAVVFFNYPALEQDQTIYRRHQGGLPEQRHPPE